MLTRKPVQASPEFIRDNQYNDKYSVVTKEDDPCLFDCMLDYHGEARIMNFPSGRECFFCEVKV